MKSSALSTVSLIVASIALIGVVYMAQGYFGFQGDITDLEGLTGKIGSEDVNWETAGNGAVTTFSVPTYDGSTQTLSMISAADIPFFTSGVNNYVDDILDGDYDVTLKLADVYLKAPVVDVRTYTSVTQAVTEIGSDEKVLLIPNAQELQDDTTFPSTLAVVVLNGGRLDCGQSGYDLTINGPFFAGSHKAFDNSTAGGDITFGGNKAVDFARPEWWNTAAPDGSTDSGEEINYCLDSGVPCFLSPGTWHTTEKVIMPDESEMVGAGPNATTVSCTTGFGDDVLITNESTTDDNIRIANLSVTVRTNDPFTGTDLGVIRLHKVDGVKIENVHTASTNNCRHPVITLQGCEDVQVSDCDLVNTNATGPVDGGMCLWIQSDNGVDATWNTEDVTITGCNFTGDNASDPVIVIEGWFNAIRNVTMSGCTIEYDDGIGDAVVIAGHASTGGDGTATDITLTGNAIYGRVVLGDNLSRCTVTGNTIYSTVSGEEAIQVDATIDVTDDLDGIVISANTIWCDEDYGIYCANSTGTIIEGNFITCGAITTDGVYVSGTTGTLVSGNQITGGGSGVFFYDAVSEGAIVNNFIENATTNGIGADTNGQAASLITIDGNKIQAPSITALYGVRLYGGGSFSGTVLMDNKISFTPSTDDYSIQDAAYCSGNLVGGTLDAWSETLTIAAQAGVATATHAPSANVLFVDCQDADTCDVTITETNSVMAQPGNVVYVVNTNEPTDILNTLNVMEGANATDIRIGTAVQPREAAIITYVSDQVTSEDYFVEVQ